METWIRRLGTSAHRGLPPSGHRGVSSPVAGSFRITPDADFLTRRWTYRFHHLRARDARISAGHRRLQFHLGLDFPQPVHVHVLLEVRPRSRHIPQPGRRPSGIPAMSVPAPYQRLNPPTHPLPPGPLLDRISVPASAEAAIYRPFARGGPT